MRFIIISGYSGAGKSVALHALEDEGFYCLDNLTPELLEFVMQQLLSDKLQIGDNIAAGVDIRGLGQATSDFGSLLHRFKEMETQKPELKCEILFIEADRETLIRRYQEAKRPHPLSEKQKSLAEAMDAESDMLDQVRRHATMSINTTNLPQYKLSFRVRSHIREATDKLFLLIQSFGYKQGVPLDSSYVFDLRCLPNPHWQPELRNLTGKDRQVARFLEACPECGDLYTHIHDFIETWMPHFLKAGKRDLTVSLGCTGGQHRSVYVVEKLFHSFLNHRHCIVEKRHRELS